LTIATAQAFDASGTPSGESVRALDGRNFFVAGALAGFGPFVAVFLGAQGWSQERIGIALSAGGVAGLLAQLPRGELLDVVRPKRLLVAVGTVMVGVGALIIALWPEFIPVSVRVRAMGRMELLPSSTLAAVRAAEGATKNYRDMQLTIAAAYGGRQEITDAVQAFLRDQLEQGRTLMETVELVTPEAIRRYLYAPDLPDPDLIRTSGEIRLSGSFCGKASTANSTSPTSIGPLSGKSTSSGLCVPFSSDNVDSGDNWNWLGEPVVKRDSEKRRTRTQYASYLVVLSSLIFTISQLEDEDSNQESSGSDPAPRYILGGEAESKNQHGR
jgi:hypothetical protein